MKKVTIYTTTYCPHCRRAKGFLEGKNIPYHEIDITEGDDLRAEISKKTGHQTVPMIFIGEQFIGGTDQLFALAKQGELDQRLGL